MCPASTCPHSKNRSFEPRPTPLGTICTCLCTPHISSTPRAFPLSHIPCALAHARGFVHDVLCPHAFPHHRLRLCIPTHAHVLICACQCLHPWLGTSSLCL